MTPPRAASLRLFLPISPGWLIIGWFVLEIAAVALLVSRLGVLATVAIGLATTLLGVMLLRQIGFSAALGLRAALDGREPGEGAMLAGVLAALGAVLLILPGFVSDLAGLALSVPAARGWLMRRFAIPAAARRRAAQPGVIDLDEADWRSLDERRLP